MSIASDCNARRIRVWAAVCSKSAISFRFFTAHFPQTPYNARIDALINERPSRTVIPILQYLGEYHETVIRLEAMIALRGMYYCESDH